MKGTMFTVGLLHDDEHPDTPKWEVACERCGEKLADGADFTPVTIVNVKGNIPRTQFEAFRRSWFKALETHRPIVMNTDELEVHNIGGELQRVLLEHHKKCAKGPKGFL